MSSFNNFGNALTAASTNDDYVQLGMNMATPASFSPSPFANLMLSGGNWQQFSGSSGCTQTQGVMTANNPSDQFRLYLSDAGLGLPTGTYTVLNPQGATIGIGTFSGPTIHGYTTATTFTFSWNPTITGLYVFVTGSLANNLGNLAVIKPGMLTSFQSGNVWDTNFLSFYTGMGVKCVRFMDSVATYYSIETNWSDRIQPGYPTLYSNQFQGYSPLTWELICDLVTRLDCDMHISIPVRATNSGGSSYVGQLATLLLANAPSGCAIYDEISDEVWNYAYPWSEATIWMTYATNTRYTATVSNQASGIYTLANHGFTNGTLVHCYNTSQNLAIYGANTATYIDYRIRSGGQAMIENVTTNTFTLNDPSSSALIGIATNQVNVMFTVDSQNTGSQNMDTNYGNQSLANWATLNSILGAGRCKHLVGSQAAGTGHTSGRVAVSGVTTEASYVAIAPYYAGDVWGVTLGISSGQVIPGVWDFVGKNLINISIYTAGSTPTVAQMRAGTGTGFVGQVNILTTSQPGSYQTQATTTIYTGQSGTGWTTLVLTSTVGFATSGSVTFVDAGSNTQIVAYTGISGNTLTGCSGGTTAVNGGTTIKQVQAPVTVTNSTAYTAFFVLTSSNYYFVIQVNFTASATASNIYATDTFSNQLFRDRRSIESNVIGGVNNHLAVSGGLPIMFYECGFDTGKTGNSPPPVSLTTVATAAAAGYTSLVLVSTSGLATSGSVPVLINTGAKNGTIQAVNYTGISGNTLTGCTDGSGLGGTQALSVGASVLCQVKTSALSVGWTSLVLSSVGSLPTSGQVCIVITTGLRQLINYTGISSNTLTGCTDGSNMGGTQPVLSGSYVYFPGDISTWLIAYQTTATQCGTAVAYSTKIAALSSCHLAQYYADVENTTYSVSNSYNDVTDARYVGLAAMNGTARRHVALSLSTPITTTQSSTGWTTLPLTSTVGFPPSGVVQFTDTNGVVDLVSYTSISSNTLQGCLDVAGFSATQTVTAGTTVKTVSPVLTPLGTNLGTVPGSYPASLGTLGNSALTYSLVDADAAANYTITGNTLYLTSTGGAAVNWNAKTAYNIRILATDGYVESIFYFNFFLGTNPGVPAPVLAGGNTLLASWDPGNVTTITTTSGHVTSLAGSDGTSRTLTGTSSTGPATATRTIGSVSNVPCLRFTSASSEYMTASNALGVNTANGCTVIVIYEYATTPAGGTGHVLLDIGNQFSNVTANRYMTYLSGSANTWTSRKSDSSGNSSTAGQAFTTGAHILIARYPGGTGQPELNVDNGAVVVGTTTPVPGNPSLSDTNFGASNESGAVGRFADGWVYRVLVYDNILSNTDVATVNTWASTNYGVA